jgi:hypothetical protein
MAHEIKLGELITDDKQQRDAIHVAVAPVVAAETLYPAQRIGFVGTDTTRVSASAGPHVGIVDPFLRGPVYPEQRCFMFLFPNTVTGMRHHWEHPAFDGSTNQINDKTADAMGVISALARQAGFTYDEMLEYAADFIVNQKYHREGGRWEGVWADDDFWNAYEIITGTKVPEVKRGGIFSCSC